MPDIESRPRGVLTDDDREYLRGEKEYKHVQSETNVKARIRERVYHSLRDGKDLLRISPEQREQIFVYWQHSDEWVAVEDRDDSLSHEYYDVGEHFEKSEFSESLRQFLGFLYLGIQESDDLEFSSMLETAIRDAELQRNREVTDWRLEFGIDERPDLEEVLRRFEAGDPSLDHHQIQMLREEADVTGDDIADYYDRLNDE